MAPSVATLAQAVAAEDASVRFRLITMGEAQALYRELHHIRPTERTDGKTGRGMAV